MTFLPSFFLLLISVLYSHTNLTGTMSTLSGQDKYQETIETTHVITTSKSREDLYQGRNSSTTNDSQDNVATIEANNDEQPQGLNFKTKKELFDFSILMVGIIFAMFMMSLNSTVVAPAMSIIATELNGLESQTWIATAYLVALNAFQPLSGRVSTYLQF